MQRAVWFFLMLMLMLLMLLLLEMLFMPTPRLSPRTWATLTFSLLFVASACGSSVLDHGGKKRGAGSGQNLQDCGEPTKGGEDASPCNAPGQGPNAPGQTPGADVKPEDGCAGADPCDAPPPPDYPGTCGEAGKYCRNGEPGQWPGQDISGKPYDQNEMAACFAGFQQAGHDMNGQWGIDVRAVKNVSVLSSSDIVDHGNEHVMVLIKSVNVFGHMNFELLNPNALYCIKNVSVLEKVSITSCRQSNVVFGKNLQILSHGQVQVVDCP